MNAPALCDCNKQQQPHMITPAVVFLISGAERASCAIIALDTPGANYRAVYAMTKASSRAQTLLFSYNPIIDSLVEA